VSVSDNSALGETPLVNQVQTMNTSSPFDNITTEKENDEVGGSLERKSDSEVDLENKEQVIQNQEHKETESQDNDETQDKTSEEDLKLCTVVKFISEFSVKSKVDVKPCNISRMILTPNGEILVIDNANYKMKLFGNNFMLLHEKAIPPLCTAVTCIDEKTIALTLRGAIRFYSIGKTGISETQKEIRINGGISDILHSNGTFLVCFQKGSDACICNLQMNGCMDIIRKEKNRLLTLYDFLQYDKDNCLIFQTNFDKGTLTCIGIDGSTMWTSSINGGPAGLAVGKDCVFVAVYGKDKIQQFSTSGSVMNGLLLSVNDGIFRPYALSFNVSTNILFVSNNFQNTVSVFSLTEMEQKEN